ncbi:MAG: hypothetical protein N3E41_00310 [Thermofilaceae archaeon]|nr:hypothetical protein [Thermofilaceae archaeon]
MKSRLALKHLEDKNWTLKLLYVDDKHKSPIPLPSRRQEEACKG